MWPPSVLRCRLTEMKPGCRAMKRARSIISLSTSAWCSGSTFTVVICVTIPVSLRISGMGCSGLEPVPRQRLPSRPGFLADPCLFDRLGDRHGPTRDVGVHALDHAAADLHHALALVLRPVERLDDGARLRGLLLRRREHRVARVDLARMNQ